jgi:hypothetical protein
LHNPDFVKPRTFYLNYLSDVPKDWFVDLNGGKHVVELDPGQMVDLPIIIKPGPTPQPVGTRFTTDVSASNLNLLKNDLDPNDLHPEYKPLGGVQVDSRVLERTRIDCKGNMNTDGIVTIDGRLQGIDKYYPKEGLQVQMVGVGDKGQLLDFTGKTVFVGRDGLFSGSFRDANRISKRFTCLFAGTDLLMSASSGFTPFGDLPDSDGDGVQDYRDNCSKAKNPDQLDTDNDGYGNACDADLNNDSRINNADLLQFKRVFLVDVPNSSPNYDLKQAADFNGDGKVNNLDLLALKKSFLSAPGPSGLK